MSSAPAPTNDKAALMQLVFNSMLGRTACWAAEKGIADLIPTDASRTIGDLATATETDPRSLYRTMRFLASHGIFAEEKTGGKAGHGQTFQHTAMSVYLRSDHPESSRAAFQMFAGLFDALLPHVDHSIRTSGSALEKGLGMGLFDFMVAHPEQAAIFDAAMTAIHGPETGAMLASYDFSGIGTLADVGGGNGSLLIGVLKQYPAMKGIVMDLEHVVDRAKGNLQAAGVADRCTVHPVNFFEDVPAGADAYLMRHIIHDWNDEQSVQILKNCRAAVPLHGKLLLVESVVPAGNDPDIGKDMDMLMMVGPGGLERTEEEYRELFAASGFELVGITPTPSPVAVIEARPV